MNEDLAVIQPILEEDLPPLEEEKDVFGACVRALGLKSIQRHVFICADQTKPNCCTKDVSLESWNYLKRRLKELELDKPTQERPSSIFRTKANCLRVCMDGPILLIYPDGVWYRNATPKVIERIIQEHLINDKIVEEYAFVIQPLTPTSSKQIRETETAAQ